MALIAIPPIWMPKPVTFGAAIPGFQSALIDAAAEKVGMIFELSLIHI